MSITGIIVIIVIVAILITGIIAAVRSGKVKPATGGNGNGSDNNNPGGNSGQDGPGMDDGGDHHSNPYKPEGKPNTLHKNGLPLT